jgi:hypothetical protein
MIDTLLGSAAEEAGVEFDLKLIICEKDKPKPIAKGKVQSVFEISEDDIEDIKIAIEELAAMAEDVFAGFGGGESGLPEIDVPGMDSTTEYPSNGGFGW